MTRTLQVEADLINGPIDEAKSSNSLTRLVEAARVEFKPERPVLAAFVARAGSRRLQIKKRYTKTCILGSLTDAGQTAHLARQPAA